VIFVSRTFALLAQLSLQSRRVSHRALEILVFPDAYEPLEELQNSADRGAESGLSLQLVYRERAEDTLGIWVQGIGYEDLAFRVDLEYAPNLDWSVQLDTQRSLPPNQCEIGSDQCVLLLLMPTRVSGRAGPTRSTCWIC